SSFDGLHEELQNPSSYFDLIICELLQKHLNEFDADFCGISVPFPGNLYAGLKCAQYMKEHYPQCSLAIGGGYPNTELRQLTETRLFEYIDFVTLDDGERPLMQIMKLLDGEITVEQLQRTFVLNDANEVEYMNGCKAPDFPHTETGVPDYSGLHLNKYLSIIEVANPMHRLWNDGRWNKMTVAHGCYWKRCSFCDVTLDYIERYEEAPAKLLVDRMEVLIEQTGQSGFHFVDEAAPPAAIQELAIEILKRGLVVSWWANVRFERAFTGDLCRLLAASGCIAVSGGLEVASDRLLSKMKKGTNLNQVTQSTKAFSDAGILVHAYLMYGFPTETDQETIDALDVVRQLFENNLILSGFWHRFAMTAHSPIGKNPEEYGVTATGPEFLGFACNELTHDDPQGCDHSKYGDGLRKALFNYMHGVGLDQPLDFWFDFKITSPTHHKKLIKQKIKQNSRAAKIFDADRVLWLGGTPQIYQSSEDESLMEVILSNAQEDVVLEMDVSLAEWLENLLPQLMAHENGISFTEVNDYFQQYFGNCFGDFVESEIWQSLRDAGLLILRVK
ncbi:MAG: radical SAM protein, partial [Lentisphaeraceae bacterium]|nr:radical SAM protein [Lentisphaeraceae bacterium]